jgi:c-di-GMP-binding flagellar brake protein YcgR
MTNRSTENRRKSERFPIHLGLRYRVSQKGFESRWYTGTTRDISKDGLCIRTRRALPAGSHIELHVDWPARYQSVYPVDLHVTGLVIQSRGGKSAVRICSHRFVVEAQALSKTA